MSDVCPKCGASVVESGSIFFECGTYTSRAGIWENPDCLRNQLAQANERLTALLSERMDKAEAKIGTRPAHVVVRELQAENERLRELLRGLVDGGQSALALRPPEYSVLNDFYPLSSSDMGELEDAIEAALEVLGGDRNG